MNETFLFSSHNNTVMHAAALTDEAELITLLAESKCGAELLDARNESRATPLHMAAQRGSITAGRALLQLRPSLLEVENVRRYHPLHLASHGGHAHFVEMLIVEFGAAVEARDGRRWTALAFAASEGHLETVDLLIRHRAPVDATDANRTTPLHLAAAKGHVEVVTTLLDSGAPLEATDVFNQNALVRGPLVGEIWLCCLRSIISTIIHINRASRFDRATLTPHWPLSSTIDGSRPCRSATSTETRP